MYHVRTDVSEERIASNIRVNTMRFSEASVLTTDTRHHIPEDDILHRHRRENLKSYTRELILFTRADRSDRAVPGMNCLLPLQWWDRVFESHLTLRYTRLFCLCFPVCRYEKSGSTMRQYISYS
jgi:hypothetical protein